MIFRQIESHPLRMYIEDEAERHITATISGIIKKNIFEDEISNKQSDTTFSNLSTSQAYL